MVRFNLIAISLYLFPALLYLYISNLSTIPFYQKPLLAIKFSIFFTVIGFVLGSFLSKKITFNFRDFNSFFYLRISKIFIFVGILSVSVQLLKFGIPLFNNGVREYIQQGIFWNIFTFSSMLGLFFFSYYYYALNESIDKFSIILIILLMILTLFTGWKGVLINFLLVLFSYSILYKKIKFSSLMVISLLFFVIFFGINALRSGLYTISFLELFNYLFYGFENFVRISLSYFSNCSHSIPLFGCQFTYDNEALINPTFNVYTALMPLYSDGGLQLVSTFFFFSSLFLAVIKDYRNSFFITFLFYILHYFFMIAHNGYIFNSGSFVFILVLLFLVDFLRIKS